MRFVLKTFHRRSHGYFIFLWASSDVNDVFSPHLPLAPLPLIVSFALLDIEDARIMATSNFKFQISNTKKNTEPPLIAAHTTHIKQNSILPCEIKALEIVEKKYC